MAWNRAADARRGTYQPFVRSVVSPSPVSDRVHSVLYHVGRPLYRVSDFHMDLCGEHVPRGARGDAALCRAYAWQNPLLPEPKCEELALASRRNHHFSLDEFLQSDVRYDHLHRDVTHHPSREITESLNPRQETPGF